MSLTDSAQVPNPLKSYWCLFSTFSSWRSYVCYDYRNYHSAITCWVSLVMHKTEIHMLPCLTLCSRYVCWSAADRYVCWSFWNHKLCTSVAKYYNTKNSSHLAGCCFRQQNYHWPIKLQVLQEQHQEIVKHICSLSHTAHYNRYTQQQQSLLPPNQVQKYKQVYRHNITSKGSSTALHPCPVLN